MTARKWAKKTGKVEAQKAPKKLRVYYAHPMSTYDTPVEERDIGTLTKLGFEVVNPNEPSHSVGAGIYGMAYFKDVVQGCDLLAFRALPDGPISAGASQEIQWAIDEGKPVIELPTGVMRRSLTVEQTREYLADAGQR